MTDADIRRLASPVVAETDKAIGSIHAHLAGQPADVADVVYRMLLMGSVGVLKQHGQSHAAIAAALRAYADMIEKDPR